MSTGDQTAYLRSKMATRRHKLDYGGPGGQWSSPPHFMKDGYQKWSESAAPAREGGALKTPGYKQMPRDLVGGNDFDDLKEGVNYVLDQFEDGPVKKAIQDAIKFGNDMVNNGYVQFTKNMIKNKDVQDLAEELLPGAKPIMEKIQDFMELVGLGHMRNDAAMVKKVGASKPFKEWCKEEAREHKGRGIPPKFLNKMEQKAASGGNRGYGLREKIEESIKKTNAGFNDSVADTKRKIDASLAKTNADLEAFAESQKPKKGMGKRAVAAEARRILESHGLTKKHVSEALKMLRGGSLAKFGSDVFKTIKTIAKSVQTAYNWLKARKKPLHAILESTDLNEENPAGPTAIPRKVAKVMGLIGLGNREKQGRYVGSGQGSSVYLEGGRMAQHRMPDGSMMDGETHGGRIGMGRKPSAYAQFVKQFAAQHPGPDLMKRAAQAWRNR